MCFSYFIKTSTSNYDSKYDPVLQEGDNGIKTAFDLTVQAGTVFAHTLFFSHKIRIPIASLPSPRTPARTHIQTHTHPLDQQESKSSWFSSLIQTWSTAQIGFQRGGEERTLGEGEREKW